MKAAFFVLLALALAAPALAADVELDGKVLVLTEDNFDEVVKKEAPILVEFYAPWCGHCKRLAPEYSAAAETLDAEGAGVKLAKVDATEEPTLGSRFDVRGYPTLKFFKNGLKAAEYNGGRTASEIVNWLKKKTGPAVVDLANKEAVEAFKAKADVAVVGFLSDAEGIAAFTEFAKSHDDDAVVFGLAPAAVAEEMGVDGSVATFNSAEEKPGVFNGALTNDELAVFVNGYSVALVSEFSDEMAPKFFRAAIEKKVVLFSDKSDDGHSVAVEALKTAAEEFRGKILFTVAGHAQARLMEYFGVAKDDTPTALALIVSDDGIKKYKWNKDDISADNVAAFTREFLAGELKAFLKSEEIPEKNDGPVTILVGKNFDEIVGDTSKNVLVEFYAPWCGHCKKLEPIYEELGEKYASNPNVVIAKVDATANEIESVPVRGFPTIKFFPSNNKEGAGIEYEGDRTLKGFSEFIDKHSVAPAASEKSEL